MHNLRTFPAGLGASSVAAEKKEGFISSFPEAPEAGPLGGGLRGPSTKPTHSATRHRPKTRSAPPSHALPQPACPAAGGSVGPALSVARRGSAGKTRRGGACLGQSHCFRLLLQPRAFSAYPPPSLPASMPFPTRAPGAFQTHVVFRVGRAGRDQHGDRDTSPPMSAALCCWRNTSPVHISKAE